MCSVSPQVAEDASRFSIPLYQLQELGQKAIDSKARAYCNKIKLSSSFAEVLLILQQARTPSSELERRYLPLMDNTSLALISRTPAILLGLVRRELRWGRRW